MKREMELILGLVMVMFVCLISGNLSDILNRKENFVKPVDHSVLADSFTPQGTEGGYVVCLDAGHGGMDSGKVAINGTLEKDINLQIVLYLKEFLEANGIKVVLTRENGNGLYSEGSSNKKREDMTKRCQIIEQCKPDLVVSIHQNSYQSEIVHGAQVFYYEGSKVGKDLAEKIQKRFDYCLGNENTRHIKPNSSYYLLKNVKQPMVIVECGFLSNRAEAEKLNTAKYQEKVAWTIHMGIMQQLQSLS